MLEGGCHRQWLQVGGGRKGKGVGLGPGPLSGPNSYFVVLCVKDSS